MQCVIVTKDKAYRFIGSCGCGQAVIREMNPTLIISYGVTTETESESRI